MALPEVDPTKIEVINPQFRIVEAYSKCSKCTLFYPQRKWLGVFWVSVKTKRSIHWYKHCWDLKEAIQSIQDYKQSPPPDKKIHYL